MKESKNHMFITILKSAVPRAATIALNWERKYDAYQQYTDKAGVLQADTECAEANELTSGS